jgi:hypothetical protein
MNWHSFKLAAGFLLSVAGIVLALWWASRLERSGGR